MSRVTKKAKRQMPNSLHKIDDTILDSSIGPALDPLSSNATAFLTNWIPLHSITNGTLFGLEEDCVAVIEVPHLLNQSECDYIIHLGMTQDLSPIQTNKYGQKVDTPLRTDLNAAFEDPVLTRFLIERISKVIPLFLEREAPAAFAGLNPLLRFNVYNTGSFFKEHMDGTFHSPLHSTLSLYTMILYLNDDFKGGETVLHLDGEKQMSIKPEVGKVLILDQRIKHEGRTVTLGKKLTLRTDIMYLRRTSAGDCGICLETLCTRKVRLPCTHAFHRNCLETWLAQNLTCPMCRQFLLPSEVKGLGLAIPLPPTHTSMQPSIAFPPLPNGFEYVPGAVAPGGRSWEEIHQIRAQFAHNWQRNRENIPPGFMD
jgi:predicted 2-oxoglutarate/Fe(II)-dependent dioxygenase YbiX